MTDRARAISRGVLSKKTGVNSETIRYYEKINLIPTPARTTNGYRVYDDTHVKRLSFIKRCRELGFKLKEVTELLDLVDGDDYTCAEIRDHTIRHLRDVENRILDLKKMRQTLKDMVSECEGGSVPKCEARCSVNPDRTKCNRRKSANFFVISCY
jgi:MerR family mercuric resistance operon transcriptional regulator